MNGMVATDGAFDQLRAELEELKSQLREWVSDRQAVLGQPHDGDWPDVLVLMPFAKELELVYSNHIAKVATNKGLSVKRADQLVGPGAIFKDIWSAIHAAKIIVADCTQQNPNVFYEVGLAHAVGRQTILISQSSEDVPFDVKYLRVIHYQYTPIGMDSFEVVLSQTIDAITSRWAMRREAGA